MSNEKNGERAVIDAINAGSSNVDCWVWDVDKKDGHRAAVFGFGNGKEYHVFCTHPNGIFLRHAIPYKEPEHEFKPFEKVIFREGDECEWSCGFFSHMNGKRFVVTGDVEARYCLPYAGNEKLLGTRDNPE